MSLSRFKSIMIIDNYNDANSNTHLSANFEINMNISSAQAIETPQLICKRTKIEWSAKQFTNSQVFKNIWARAVLSYFDWVSFIPELKDFSVHERVSNMLIAGRSMQSLWATFTHRSAGYNAPGILFPGGCYFPRDKEEWKKMDPNIIMSCSRISDMVNYEIIDEMKSLEITDEEFAILKVLCFFTAVPQLSKEGYEIVQQAKRKYANILTELIRTKHSNKPFTEIIERVNRFMLILPTIEKLTQIDNEVLGMMIVFNMAQMKNSLCYELHIGKK
uniref:NR LBD domain-containing protein n=1 Tax=Panagrolaimus davidi TaxID=227884 RepID=A0A914QMN8_9BILA